MPGGRPRESSSRGGAPRNRTSSDGFGDRHVSVTPVPRRGPSLEANPNLLSVRPRTYVRAVTRSHADVRRVEILSADGLSDYEVERRTGVPRSTVQRWRRLGPPTRQRHHSADGERCPSCARSHQEVNDLPEGPYAYLLGQYLGDGTIYATGRGAKGRTLRISSDASYPGIIRECCVVIGQVRGLRPRLRVHTEKRMVDVVSAWTAWPCFFPQHGPGRKHSRRIELAPWQKAIVEAYPGPFLRGLIHSDGWRGVNRVHVKGRTYEYPRYQFSNRSDDIRQLFTYACELVGVAWRPWGIYHISVARRDAVLLLDQFVGPKR
jgi:hypothetical protein